MNLFLEPFSGLSGDMLNALLIDLGADADHLKKELASLPVDGYDVTYQRMAKSSIWGTDFDVVLAHGQKDSGIEGDFEHHHHDDSHDHDLHHHHHDHDHSHHDQSHGHSHHSHGEGHTHEHLHDHNHTHDHDHHSHSHHHHHGDARGFQEIKDVIEHSHLSPYVKEKAIAVFYDIAKAEAAVHQQPVEHIHFHEVGAIDSIVDIVSFFILFESLGIDQVYSTPITEGSGTITVAHGVMPVPVPAVMQLRQGTAIPMHQDLDIHTELVTPTGLAILKALQPIFQTPANLAIQKVGYGFGKRETGKFNALRGSLFEATSHTPSVNEVGDDVIYQIEASIDDQTPEQLGYLMDLLFDKGALDVYYQSIHMKKNRPAVLLVAMIRPHQLDEFTQYLFKESSTIGFRVQPIHRRVMERSIRTFPSRYGEIHFKDCRYGDIRKQTLEFEDCAAVARHHQISLSDVYQNLQQDLQLFLKENE